MRRREFLLSAGIGVVGFTVVSPWAWAESFEPPRPRAMPHRSAAWLHGDPRVGCASSFPERMAMLAVPAFSR